MRERDILEGIRDLAVTVAAGLFIASWLAWALLTGTNPTPSCHAPYQEHMYFGATFCLDSHQ